MAEQHPRPGPDVTQIDPLMARRRVRGWPIVLGVALLAVLALMLFGFGGDRGTPRTTGTAAGPSPTTDDRLVQQPPRTGTRATGTVGGTAQPMIPGRTTPDPPPDSVPVNR
ncbi:hypothetical protein PQJ75_12325 [Rhodoplanes sp. TEM]|uniref:Uncharacterized protein n=1 Tax=Rhodoplanes tepidamans TaxID=200616 RepID=A0ABT5JI75_RHOTP|nr:MULTISPECIES: hypothetical protein [Rhodoplanes]MDC7789388.1 hypothetical protein [Rhodoplanes tepidamans]MDC7984518.1 hypothetical protein [Rhodoplanes sp. TEM]MDQ0357927.1 hypothetical protein [Rhodoplanes tepidamans]